MNLFDYDPDFNILPCDGEAYYFGSIFSPQESDLYLQHLLNNIEWKNDEVNIYGKHIITRRKVAWYGDNNFPYRYSNITRNALNWTKELLALKAIIEIHTNITYNSCLLNLYHDGEDAMSWHCDDEVSLGENTNIASLSFGAVRKFSLKHKTSKQTVSLLLATGALLVMKGSTQSYWLHCLPKMKNVTSPRINLTFRTFR